MDFILVATTQFYGNKFFKNSKGQVLIEFVLLGVLAIGLLTIGVRTIKSKKITQNLTQGPWEKTAGMIESGNWNAPAAAKELHPNRPRRMLSHDPNK